MRRRVLSRAILAIAVVVLVSGAALFERPRRDDAGSYSDGAALDAEGQLQLLPAGSDPDLIMGSRVLDPGADAEPTEIAAALELAQQQRDWLASGWLPEGEYRELVTNALLDLKVLSSGGGTLASINTNWHYVWPRDASFAAVAFARTGHLDDAAAVLEYLQQAQASDGSFEARYVPDGSGPPDGRTPQTDGTGWALWALDAVLDAAPADLAAELLVELDPLLQRSTAFLLDQVAGDRALPAPSPDYWEHRERVVTLGTAAPVLAGLEAAARIHELAGDADRAQQVASVAADVRDAVETFFGPHGYGRYPGPSHADAASAFLLPPYQPTPLPGAVEAWQESVAPMLRPAGGIAPGAGWKEQNLSWTPETALYALAAASIDDDETARHWLDWLEAHRTPIGALPEKVTADGGPSGPAPLAWTCALVILTVAELEA